MTTIKDVYNIPPKSVSKELYELEGYFRNTGLNLCGGDFKENTRVEKKTHVWHSFDGRRIWELASLWLDGIPFMLCQRAGREGDDHKEEFVTNSRLHREAVEYLRSLERVEELDAHSEEYDDKEVCTFYGHTLSDFYDPDFVPEYKVGDIITIKNGKTRPRGYLSEDDLMDVRVEILDVFPDNKRAPYRVVELDRVVKFCSQKWKDPILFIKDAPDWETRDDDGRYSRIYLRTDGKIRVDD